MNTSPVQTGAVGSVTAAIFTLIAALVKHYNIDLSADAQLSIAVGVTAAAHYLGQQIASRSESKAAKTASPAA